MSLYKLYGIVAGIIGILIGSFLVFYKPLDLYLSDKETTKREVRKSRIFWGIFIIIGSALSISAVLFGWPPVIGYIVQPP